jgi:proteasome lid subunit RPN8/RPN11
MITDSLFIPKSIIGQLINHSLKFDPDESCGLLQGKGKIVSKFHAVTNINETPKNRYTMDPSELIRIDNLCDDEDENITGIFHSHTHTQAYPSDTDINNALISGYLKQYYVIASLVEKTRPIIRAFKIDSNGNVFESFIDFDGPKYISR